MKHCELATEAQLEAANELRRQPDLGYEQQALTIEVQRIADQPQEHLGLAAAGNSI